MRMFVCEEYKTMRKNALGLYIGILGGRERCIGFAMFSILLLLFNNSYGQTYSSSVWDFYCHKNYYSDTVPVDGLSLNLDFEEEKRLGKINSSYNKCLLSDENIIAVFTTSVAKGANSFTFDIRKLSKDNNIIANWQRIKPLLPQKGELIIYFKIDTVDFFPDDFLIGINNVDVLDFENRIAEC
jgi:hypothetical protein